MKSQRANISGTLACGMCGKCVCSSSKTNAKYNQSEEFIFKLNPLQRIIYNLIVKYCCVTADFNFLTSNGLFSYEVIYK